MAADSLRITQLYCYPVKGCRGIGLQEALVLPTGVAYDRRWMVTDEGGKFLTQRQLPRLALVEVGISPPSLLLGDDPGAHPDAALVLNAPGMPELRVLINGKAGQQLVPVSVWDWSGQAADEGSAAAQWFSQFLGRPARLVRYAGQPEASSLAGSNPLRRQCDQAWTRPGTETCFADGYPLLLASESSLADLNAQMAESVPMNRFRPNVVVDAPRPWEEDCWGGLVLGGLQCEQVKPCDRCRVPCINQETAEVGEEPRETLHRLRSGNVLGWAEPKSFKHSIFFAVNVVPSGQGVLRVGDAVDVVSRRSGPPVPRAA